MRLIFHSTLHAPDPVPLIERVRRLFRPAGPEPVSAVVHPRGEYPYRPAVYPRADGDVVIDRDQVRLVPRHFADTLTDLPVVPGFMRRQPWIAPAAGPVAEVGDDTLAMLRGEGR